MWVPSATSYTNDPLPSLSGLLDGNWTQAQILACVCEFPEIWNEQFSVWGEVTHQRRIHCEKKTKTEATFCMKGATAMAHQRVILYVFPWTGACHGPSASPEWPIISHGDKLTSVSPFLVVRWFYLSHMKILIRTSQQLVRASWQKYTGWRKHKSRHHSAGNISIFPLFVFNWLPQK